LVILNNMCGTAKHLRGKNRVLDIMKSRNRSAHSREKPRSCGK
jgi:hypothetical protein